MQAYSQSKIASGCSASSSTAAAAPGLGHHGNLSHPVSRRRTCSPPGPSWAGRRHAGRADDPWLSARGLLVGTPETAALPALYAATSPEARPGASTGPGGSVTWGGAPAEQKLFSRLRSEEEARRIWRVSQELTGAVFVTP